MRVAVIFAHIGPYHRARLAAASQRLQADGDEVVAIDVAGRDRANPWQANATPGAYRLVRLFDDQDYGDLTPAAIARAVDACLDSELPTAVAIPGWSTPEALAGLRWCRRHRVPALLMSESSRHDAARSVAREFLKRCVVRQFSSGLVGGRTHAAYAMDLGLPPTRVFLGYDVVDNDHFARGAAAARADLAAVRARFHLPARFFLASCRFIPKKNLALMIDAYAAYRRSPPSAPWDLVVCGDGPLRGALEDQVKQLAITDSVHFPGFVSYADLPNYYGAANAFVHASLSEQWGLVVNEALAAGLPVLVSRTCGCATELVVDGRNGFTFDPADTGALTALLRRLAGDECDLDTMAHAGADLIRSWSPVRFANGLAGAFHSARLTPPTPFSFSDRAVLSFLLRAAG